MGNKKNISVGISDFKELIEGNNYFTDKSLLIKEVLGSGAKVTLVPRPRRFGKTLNLSMIRYFFEKNLSGTDSNRHLFTGLKIEQEPTCMAHQGQYPVIWLTFKDCKAESWEECYRDLQEVIKFEFARHAYLLSSTSLGHVEKTIIAKFLEGSADDALHRRALLTLSDSLAKHYQKPVVILIDEYDTPIQAAFLHNYYEQAIAFFRSFLGAGLKDNSSLIFGVLTGILRIAKESIFSGINNLDVCPITAKRYADRFGFLESEVIAVLNYFDMQNSITDVRKWYDGYQSGPYKVYNPWSIINLAQKDGLIQPYWVNTSDNALIKTLLQQSGPNVKEDLELLIAGKPITKVISEYVVMPDIYQDENTLWNFLLMSGYLTFEHYRPDPNQEGQFLAELKTPNAEVAFVYNTQIQSWFVGGEDSLRLYQKMLQNLVAGNIREFSEIFELFSLETISSFDTGGKKPEKFYHGLVLGMLASLRNTHEIVSNRESGWGRYDVMVIPKDKNLPGIIIEFKTVGAKHETLEAAAQNALKQINDREYEVELHRREITRIIKLGIAFKGKESLVLVAEQKYGIER